MRPKSRSARPWTAVAHAFLGQPAHFEQTGLEDLEFFLQMSDEAFHGAVSPTRSGR